MNKNVEDKQALRARMRALRRALGEKQQQEASQAVWKQLEDWEVYRNARVVMAYAAARGELSVEPVIRDILASGRTLCLPRCESPGIMTARRVASLDQLVTGAYGLQEPDDSCEVMDRGAIDLILVPGTAFDARGGRLGQGGGYYDRFLPGCRAALAGVCHAFAVVSSVPCAEHDAVMDWIITPAGRIACRGTRTQEDRI